MINQIDPTGISEVKKGIAQKIVKKADNQSFERLVNFFFQLVLLGICMLLYYDLKVEKNDKQENTKQFILVVSEFNEINQKSNIILMSLVNKVEEIENGNEDILDEIEDLKEFLRKQNQD
ncbi:hypothetical protein [Flammeovirga aprica]|uniref:Uncharacterized protein n=1 Tax=Flammeovirga aprica JL-4 TaxID=694437 RepID=A0A7X9P1Z1_9BACT|nr:hypothetical protein [Flammeovirga aprica]NME67199.1 hypothetical protein [Flammeovirga aprica JL-4]